MYRSTRTIHRWMGLIASLFLIVIAVTGFLLATKSQFGWIRPEESEGTAFRTIAEVVTLDQVVASTLSLNLHEIKSIEDIDRIDYRPNSNIFKVVSNNGYREVQVDGKSGKILNVSFRVDQFAEDVHDLSFFSDKMHDYALPLVAVLLFFLSLTGIGVFFVPVFRRYKYRHSNKP